MATITTNDGTEVIVGPRFMRIGAEDAEAAQAAAEAAQTAAEAAQSGAETAETNAATSATSAASSATAAASSATSAATSATAAATSATSAATAQTAAEAAQTAAEAAEANAEGFAALVGGYDQSVAALALIDWYVDADNGSDANNGLTEDTAFATIAAARSAASVGDYIGVKTGQVHYLTAADDAGGLNRQNFQQSLVGYGSTVTPAVISAGQNLSGKTWTAQGSGVYKTTITLLTVHTPNGTSTNTTYPFVRLGETYFTWVVGGADIAANLTTLESTDNGFAINVTGETDEDIRDSASGSTGFDLYVRLAGGSDPSGLDIITLFSPGAYTFACDLLQDLEVRDAWGKDTTGSVISLGNKPRLRRFRSIGAGCHGWVGPCEAWGYYAKSHPRVGMSGASIGRAAGAGFNLFSNVDQVGMVQVHRGIETDGFTQHIYGHVSGNDTISERIEFYPAVDTGWADNKCRNVGTALQVDPSGTPPVVTSGVYFYTTLDWEPSDNFLIGAEDFVFDLGGTVAFQNTTAVRQVIYNANGGRGTLDIGPITFTSTQQNTVSFNKRIAFISGTVTTSPALTLRGTILPQTGDDDHFYCAASAANCDFDLTLTEGAETGDLIENGRTVYPNSLTVTHDCTFGFADQTSRANVRTLLNGAGKTHDIDNDTTLLRQDGTVAEGPA